MSKRDSSCCPPDSCACCRSALAVANPNLFRALADPTRLSIIARLARCERPVTVSEIACCTPIDVSVVSRHLARMHRADLVCRARSGKEVRYALCCTSIARTLRAMADDLESCCGARAAVEERGVTTPLPSAR